MDGLSVTIYFALVANPRISDNVIIYKTILDMANQLAVKLSNREQSPIVQVDTDFALYSIREDFGQSVSKSNKLHVVLFQFF